MKKFMRRRGKKIFMDKKLEELLYSRGVFHSYLGYDCFVRSVHLALEDEQRLQHVYKEIYFEIAIESHRDVRAVERNIRTVRDAFLRNGGKRLLVEMAGGNFWEDKRPYPREMIEVFAYYLKKYADSQEKS